MQTHSLGAKGSELGVGAETHTRFTPEVQSSVPHLRGVHACLLHPSNTFFKRQLLWGDPDGTPGSCFQALAGPSLAAVGIWGVSQQCELTLSFLISVFYFNSALQIK